MKKNEIIKKVVYKKIDQMGDEIISFTKRLVQIPSVVGEEGNIQKLIEQTFREMRLETKKIFGNKEVLKKHEAYCNIKYDYFERPNVIGILNGTGNGNSIILNGHVDVVSPEPLSLWKHDPWSGEIEEGRLYGRGSWDMKAGIASMIYALKAIQHENISLRGNVILESVIEEEAGGSGGTLTTILDGITADAAIIPEPTSLNVFVASAGVKYFKIKILGRSNHPFNIKNSVNAFEKAILIYNELKKLDKKRSQIRYPLFKSTADYSCNLNIGEIKSGNWPSTIPGWAEMNCRISFVPGENGCEIINAVEHAILNASNRDKWMKENPPEIRWEGWNANPSVINPNTKILKILKSNAHKIFDRKPKNVGFAGGLDTRLFIQYSGTPSFCFGPRGSSIHGIDEYVLVEDIPKIAKVLAGSIIDWCN